MCNVTSVGELGNRLEIHCWEMALLYPLCPTSDSAATVVAGICSFALIVTAKIRPSGSHMLEVYLRISHFVASMVNIVVSGLGEACVVSAQVSYHRPRTLTGLVSLVGKSYVI